MVVWELIYWITRLCISQSNNNRASGQVQTKTQIKSVKTQDKAKAANKTSR